MLTSDGISYTHDGHHLAHKFITTIYPRNSLSETM